MKKTLITCAIAFSAFVTAQIESDAPWIQELRSKFTTEELSHRSADQPFKFQEVQEAFNEYWADKDHAVKGSGYKPFKRWEYFWKDYVKEDGSLPTGKNVWDAYELKSSDLSIMSDESNWQGVGPYTHLDTGTWSNGRGRVNAIVVDPNNASTWYVGTPAGGLWKTTDGGSNWTPLTDELPQIGVSGIAIDPANSNIIYIATGDDDANNTVSAGVFKSTDGGITWNQTGLNPSNTPSSMNEIYINPNNSNMLWLATRSGIYKTTDAGTTWVNKQSGAFADLKLKPGDPNTIYATSATYNNQSTGCKIYKSTNAGESFSEVPIFGSFKRLVLSVTAANPNYVYVFGANGTSTSILRSSDSGGSFSTRTSNISGLSTGQNWYDFAMCVSDTQPEEVYIGTVNLWKSSNGGSSFTNINSWSNEAQATYTHADIHTLRSFNGRIFCGSDGGIYESTTAGSSFTNRTDGLQIGQFYHIDVSPTDSNKIVGGLQDNGGYGYNNGNGQWNNYYGADGMDVAIDPTNDSKIFGFIQNGSSMYISNNNGASLGAQPSGPGGAWVTPLEMNTAGELYASGNSGLYQFNGSSFSLKTSSGAGFSVLEIDRDNPDYMYGASGAQLKKSSNRGSSFSTVYTFSGSIKAIEVHSTDSNIIYVATSNKVYKSTNGGAAFTEITSNLPSGQVFYTLAHQDGHSANPLYLGTSIAVYRIDDNSPNWESFFNNLPNTPVRELEITVPDNIITAGTYGRGVWQSEMPSEIVTVDVRIVSIDNPNTTNINCGDIIPKITIKNGGQSAIDDFIINYNLNGSGNLQFSWTPAMGSVASGATQVITLSSMTPNSGSNVINVTAVLSGDVIPGNDDNQLTFNANQSGVYSIVNQFESANDELVSYNESGGTSVWERGAPNDVLLSAAASGSSAYVTDLDGNHPDNAMSYLVSRCYDFTQITDPTLRFNMAFDIENDYDVLYMEYSLNQGEIWTHFGKKTSLPLWYNSNTPYGSGNADCQKCPGQQWTGEGENTHISGGTNATIREYAYNFATNASNGETDLTTASNVMFRFVLVSDTNTNEEGVLIDDFVIDATLGINDFNSSEVAVYPNPMKNIVNVKLANPVSDFEAKVYDLVGKEVYSSNNFSKNSTTFEIDLSSISVGVYLLQINADNRQITKKIIKN